MSCKRSNLSAAISVGQAMCKSLGTASPEDAIQLCVCSEQLSDPVVYWEVTSESMTELNTWWRHRMACPDNDYQLTDDLYLDIVSR